MTTPSLRSGMGANVYPGGCSFRVWAPNADAVDVITDPRGTPVRHPMARDGDSGYWSCDVDGVRPADPYNFRIQNGSTYERVDAYARDVDDNEDVTSLVVDPRTDWGQPWSPFATPGFDDLILYQVHVGSFSGLNDGITAIDESADYDQFATKLDYVRSLGFNALALLPLSEYRKQAEDGYAPTNWFAPETAYGTPARLRALVDLAHAKGLAVLFDVVYNHAATDGNRYWNYDGDTHDGGIYFEGGWDTDWGKGPAHWKREVRDFFLDNARMFLDEYRGDGLRFDAAHAIQWESLAHILAGLRANPFWHDKYLVAEWTGDRRDQWPHVIRDLGFNAVWGMAGPWAFRHAIWGNDPVGQMKAVIDLDGYDAPWNVVRYFLGSHDQIADGKSGGQTDHRYPVEMFGGRPNGYARAQARMGWALNAASPGTPMLFMGCESHHHGYWWPSPDLNPAHADHRIDWSIMGDPTAMPMRTLVRDANQIRWDNPALRTRNLQFTHEDRDNGVLAFKRWTDDGNVLLVVANFSDHTWSAHDYGVATANTPGRWHEIFNSQAPCYDGWDDSGNAGREPWTEPDGRIYINLPKWSVLIFRQVD